MKVSLLMLILLVVMAARRLPPGSGRAVRRGLN
jgi:hypothetical protein